MTIHGLTREQREALLDQLLEIAWREHSVADRLHAGVEVRSCRFLPPGIVLARGRPTGELYVIRTAAAEQ